jgi:hypothetical protein
LLFLIPIVLFGTVGALAGPLTDQGTQPPLTHSLRSSVECAGCHSGYDLTNNLEPWNTWAGSLMAQASRDPLFWAALDVANNDLPGAGDFCLRCHVSKGWLAGRSEPPGGSADGCGLQGKLDERGNDFEGVTCHLCHRMMANPSPPVGQDSLYFENGQFWIDDTDCGGSGEPCRHGPYNYPGQGEAPPPHAWAYSTYHRDSGFCGNCHNVTNPVKNLIDDGVNTGIRFPIERTYKEWQQSDFADTTSGDFKSCQACHMPDAMESPAYACVDLFNDRSGDLPKHQFAGGNAWVPDVLRQEYPLLGLSEELTATRDFALNMLQTQSAQVELTLPDTVMEGSNISVQAKVTNLTGHKLPTGYPEGRRMWLNVQVRDAGSNLIWESGAYDPATGILSHDPQIKVYEAKVGIYNYNGTNECDCEDSMGNHLFHFVLNDCVVKDNRIPPQGFLGMNDPETEPKNYPYPETYPGSGVLVNFDETSYSIPIPLDTSSPLTVSATLRYQTTSKEYVEFLLDEAIANSFPDDCIERIDGFENRSRAEILYDMWVTYDRAPPVDMTTDMGSTVVSSATGVAAGNSVPDLHLAQNYPNPMPPGASGTRIAYYLPADTNVRLDILDVNGRHVRNLTDRFEPMGPHSELWDGRDDQGLRVAAGVYLARLQVQESVLSKRMIVIR